MFSKELMRQLLTTFADEAEEHIAAMTAHLLELEKLPAADGHAQLLVELFREAHSLKGAAMPSISAVLQRSRMGSKRCSDGCSGASAGRR